jgi:hypothetical protein
VYRWIPAPPFAATKVLAWCPLLGMSGLSPNAARLPSLILSGPSQLGLSLLQKYFSDPLELNGGRPFQGPPFPVHALLR